MSRTSTGSSMIADLPRDRFRLWAPEVGEIDAQHLVGRRRHDRRLDGARRDAGRRPVEMGAGRRAVGQDGGRRRQDQDGRERRGGQ
jgi:hypothetical protein